MRDYNRQQPRRTNQLHEEKCSPSSMPKTPQVVPVMLNPTVLDKFKTLVVLTDIRNN